MCCVVFLFATVSVVDCHCYFTYVPCIINLECPIVKSVDKNFLVVPEDITWTSATMVRNGMLEVVRQEVAVSERNRMQACRV